MDVSLTPPFPQRPNQPMPPSPVVYTTYCDGHYYPVTSMTAELALKGRVDALPSPIEATRQGWMASAQTSAFIVSTTLALQYRRLFFFGFDCGTFLQNGILAVAEVAFLQMVKLGGTGKTATEADSVSSALRFFVYVGLTLSLGGTMSSLIMVDILGEVPSRFALRPIWPSHRATTLDSLLDGRWTVAKANRDLSRFIVMLAFAAQLILFIACREPPAVFIPATVLISLTVLPLVAMHFRSRAS